MIQDKLCKIDDYTWDAKPIGSGAYGSVYKGEHKTSKMQVAIKILDESLFKNSDEKLHFYREFNYMHLVDHPYCIKLVNFCFEPPAIITPFMDLGSLDDFLKNGKPFTPTQKMCTIYSICSTMDAIHYSNFIHRDFKPANILMKQNGKYIDPYISDFGSARYANSNGQLTICPKGTPLHIAPECCFSENYTNSIDVFSFGVTYLQFFNYDITEYSNGKKIKKKTHPFTLINTIAGGSRYKRPDNMSKDQYDIYLQCTNLNDNDRPTFQELADMFEKTETIWFKGVVKNDYLDYVAQCKKVCNDYKEKQKKKKPKKRKISSLSSLASLASSSS